VALVSGISIGDDNRNPLAVQLFVDYITGHIGSTAVPASPAVAPAVGGPTHIPQIRSKRSSPASPD
jgi:hypothetical protein